MIIAGTSITVNNVNMRNNGEAGLSIGNEYFNDQYVNEITLAGDISLTNNFWGFTTSNAFGESIQGTVRVTGNLISNRNKYGVVPLNPPGGLTIAVGGSYSGKSGKSVGSGSLTACDNYGLDIGNRGGSFTFVGSDYTCDTTDGPVPDCKPCYPGCSSSDSEDGSGRTLGLTLSDFVAGEDLDFADMGHGEFPL